jgi:subtilisin family serine protease
MEKTSFKVFDKASMSLSTVLRRQTKKLRPLFALRAAGFESTTTDVVKKEDMVSLLVEATEADKVMHDLGNLTAEEGMRPLSDSILSARVTLSMAQQLLKHDQVVGVQTKKEYQLHLDAVPENINLIGNSGVRTVEEKGNGVFIGIVDSGFDLSHPMFRDAAGKLRVEGLLDQTGKSPQEFTSAQLEKGWSDGTNPGKDENGHGTHVASIAGGTSFNGFEGIAPEARFLLVKTNFLDTADGVQWIFSKAGSKACVVNMSLGGHFGSHDGTSLEEMLIDQVSGPGKIVVISAGNERESNLHIGGRLLPNESQTVRFDVPGQGGRAPEGILTLWYDPADTFTLALATPGGQELAVPAIGNVDTFSSSSVDIEIGRKTYPASNLIQVQIILSFRSTSPPPAVLNNWAVRLTCNAAVVGRIDGWFANNGFGQFRAHPLVEQARTVAMAATAKSCIALASHVSKNAWSSDAGPQQDLSVLVGRSSPFSSQGPTRDGRPKPDMSAPGQYVTAALAAGSELAGFGERAWTAKHLLTIEGTSMAAPVLTGVVALLLQKKKSLKPDDVRRILASSATSDAHVGTQGWNPTFGNGKVNVEKAIASV